MISTQFTSTGSCAVVDRPFAPSIEPGVSFLDVGERASLIEIFARNGETTFTYVGQNGWDRIASPSPGLELKIRLFEKLAARPYGQLYRAALQTMNGSLSAIQKATTLSDLSPEDLARTFAPACLGRSGKAMLTLDIVQECRAADAFSELLRRCRYDGHRPAVYGEESFFDAGLDLSMQDRPVVILDTVDGTDEVEQGMGGWCSSLVLFLPRENRILAAFIALPDKTIYFAIEDFVGKCRLTGDDLRMAPHVQPLSGPSSVTAISESLVSFYGHKPSRLRALGENRRYRGLLERLAESPRARVRTQGGAPMMMRLADRCGYRQVDVVFELLGQAPHDVVAGLLIARLAGATVCDLQGRPIDLCRALRRPADPASRLTYVLAASESLAREVLAS